MMRFSAKRFSDFGNIRYRASLLSLKPTIPKSVPLSLLRMVITRFFFNFGLKVAVSGWLLPQRVDLRLAAVFNDLREAGRLDLEKFHCGNAQQRALAIGAVPKKPARELRQGGSYYRCCIPAWRIVSPQSIAPDGGEISSRQRDAQLKNAAHFSAIVCAYRRTRQCIALLFALSSEWIGFFLFVFVFVAATSCTMLVNRRDFHSPGACACFIRSGQAVVRH